MEIDDFNVFIKGKYPEFIKEIIEDYENYQNVPTVKQPLLAIKYIRELILNANVTITSGSGPLPSDYLYWKSATGTYNNQLTEISLVKEEEKDYRLVQAIGQRPERYPVAVLRGDNVYIWPKNITPVSLTYYKEPVVPFLDYYIDADDNNVYLAQGATGISVPSGGTTSGGVAGPTVVSSNTIEMDIPIDLYFEFMNHILSALGIRIGADNISQYAELQQQKEKSQ
ncbi:MAG: hypothetical protein WC343_12525 [Bacilli bacterium]